MPVDRIICRGDRRPRAVGRPVQEWDRAAPFDMDSTPFNLDALLQAVFDRINAASPSANGDHLLSIASGVPHDLVGDADTLSRILTDVIGGAIACTGAQRMILAVDVPGQPPDDAAGRTSLRFTVSNGGTGMTGDQAAALLTALTRTDSAASLYRKDDVPSIASGKQLVDRLGGRISLDCEAGRGFTFSFTAVLEVPGTGAGAAPGRTAKCGAGPVDGNAYAGAMHMLRGARILLAEDHPTNQHLAREVLQQAGCRVDVADNGAEALRALAVEGARYDVVLMDIRMPVMDGIETTREIRRNPAYEGLPVIALTANTAKEDQEFFEKVGMDGFLAKPVHIADLYATLARWLPESLPAMDLPEPVPSGGGRANGAGDWPPDGLVEGVDAAAGLAHAGGDRQLYARMLEDFCTGNAMAGREIGDALSAGNLEQARSLAHNLAATAGAIGADRLSAAAAALENAIAGRGGAPEDMLDGFRRDLECIVDAIRSVAPPARPGPCVPVAGTGAIIDREELAMRACELEAALEDHDLAAQDIFEKLARLLAGQGHDSTLGAIGTCLGELEFAQARTMLRQLQADLAA